MGIQRRQCLQGAAGAALWWSSWAHSNTAARTLWGYPAGSPPARFYGQLAERTLGRHPDLSGLLSPSVTAQVGNSGLRAMETVAKAPADGRTLLLAATSAMTLMPQLKALKFNPMEALQPVARLFEFAPVFCIGPAVPESVRDLKGYGAWLRENPARNQFGVPSLGSAAHFMGKEVARGGDFRLQVTGYQGTVPLIEDLLNSQVPAAVLLTDNTPLAMASGTVRVLAVGSAERWPGLPDTPTLKELGLSQQRFADAFGLFAPRGTPASALTPLADALEATLTTSELQPLLQRGLFRLAGMPPERFQNELQADVRSWRDQIALNRISVD